MVSSALGAAAKDVWVLSSQPDAPLEPWVPSDESAVGRDGPAPPARHRHLAAHRREPVLDGPLRRARRGHRPHAARGHRPLGRLPPAARVGRRAGAAGAAGTARRSDPALRDLVLDRRTVGHRRAVDPDARLVGRGGPRPALHRHVRAAGPDRAGAARRAQQVARPHPDRLARPRHPAGRRGQHGDRRACGRRSTRCSKGCSRSPASPPRAWCATSAGTSSTPADASSARRTSSRACSRRSCSGGPTDVDALVLESVLLGARVGDHLPPPPPGRARPSPTCSSCCCTTAPTRGRWPTSWTGCGRRSRAIPLAGRSPDQRDHLLSDVVDLLDELDTVAFAAAITEDGRRARLAESLESMLWRLHATADEIERVHFVRVAPSQSLRTPGTPGPVRAVTVRRYDLVHRTTYDYADVVTDSYGRTTMTPARRARPDVRRDGRRDLAGAGGHRARTSTTTATGPPTSASRRRTRRSS